jgi:tetratricopeptide (TPR) repeat protein
MRFHLLTVVWGREFTDRFARVTLRSLMAPGNLPDLAAAHPVIYSIHTTAADAERLRAHPTFKAAAKVAEFRLQLFSPAEIDPKNPSSHWILWHRGAAELRDTDDALITVAADHLFSRGTMLRWAELFLGGHLAIFGSGVQVVLETLEEEIERSFPFPGPIDLPIKALHALLFRHLHPVKISMLRGSPRWMSHPEEHLRAIPGYGFTQSVLTSHAIAFRPRAIHMNDNFCPTEKLDRCAFESCRYLSLEPILKHLPQYVHRWRMDDGTLSQFGAWGDSFFFAANLLESRTTHAYALADAIPAAQRRRAELAARFFVGQMHASRQIFRVWRYLRRQGRHRAARWLAAAHMHARLRRRLVLRGPSTFFLPAESVLGRLDRDEQRRLLADSGIRLAGAVRAHFAAGHHKIKRGDWLAPSDAGTIRTGGGARYAVAPRGAARVIAGPLRVDEIEIYVVNRPLVQLSLGPRSANETLRAAARAGRYLAQRGASGTKGVLRRLIERDYRLYKSVVRLRNVVGDVKRGRRAPSSADAQDASGAAAIYRQALAVRALDAMRQLYSFYQAAVLAGTEVEAVPATRLARLSEQGARSDALLATAVKEAADFAEAWLELGFARLDAAQPDAALEAFARAGAGASMFGRARFDPDPLLLAAVERARLLVARGRSAEALAALEAARPIRPVPRGFYDLLGTLLLQHGRIEAALDAFERCMQGDYINPSFANLLPQDLATLEATVADERGTTRTAGSTPQ